MTIKVRPSLNTPPVAADDYAFTTANTPVTVAVLANDGDAQGDPLVVGAPTLISGQGSVLRNADGSLTFTPAPGFIGEARIGYTVSDGYGGTDNAVLVITVANPRDAIRGDSGNDQITLMSGLEDTYYLQLGGFGSTPSQVQTVVSATLDQIIDSRGGNDYVETGRGNDVLFLGDSGANAHPVSGQLPTVANVMATNLMQLADGSMVGSDGNLNPSARYTTASDNRSAAEWADLGHSGAGADRVYGQAGVDLIYGGADNDTLSGGEGIDGVRGGSGNDILSGGSGSDVLRGDLGAGVFAWTLGDESQTFGSSAAGSGNPYGLTNTAVNVVNGATDVILDFNRSNTTTDHDKLDLRDLLQGEARSGTDVGNLANFLHFEKSGTDTVIHVSTIGGFANDTHTAGGSYSAMSENQTIILKGVDLTLAGTTDTAIIQDLLNKGKLITD